MQTVEKSRGIKLGSLESEVSRLQSEAKTAMLVAIDNEAAGIIAVADTIKDSSKEAIADLHKIGLRVVMITGDNQKTADAIAKQVGIDQVLAEILPEGKIVAILGNPFQHQNDVVVDDLDAIDVENDV